MKKNISPDPLQLLHEGIRLVSEHKAKNAETVLRKLLKGQPRNTDAWWLLGRALSLQMRLDESIEAYRRATQLEPDRAVFWESLGVLLIQVGEVNEGKTTLTKAFDLDPNSLRPSEYIFGKLLEDNRENPLYWYGLGLVLGIQGKTEMSLQAMLKASQLDSTFTVDSEQHRES
jgi:superkiller protein 3